MSADQCRQFINSTTNSQGLNDLIQLINFDRDRDGDPYSALDNGHINDIDEQSQVENSNFIDILSEQSNSLSFLFPEHYCQRQDPLDIGHSQDMHNFQSSEGEQRSGSDEENPSFQLQQMGEKQQEEEFIAISKDERMEVSDIRARRKILDKKGVRTQKKDTKAKRIKKRMKQQMKSLGENTYYKFKKNVNMPKAIGRYLIAFHSQFKDTLFKDYADEFDKLSKKLKEKADWIKKSKKNSFKLQHLKQFFSNEEQHKQSNLNRLLMRKIIQLQKRKQIIENNQVKDKLEYLVSSKIFSLRCSNSSLASRMQMR